MINDMSHMVRGVILAMVMNNPFDALTFILNHKLMTMTAKPEHGKPVKQSNNHQKIRRQQHT
jgi:hypothetical protein